MEHHGINLCHYFCSQILYGVCLKDVIIESDLLLTIRVGLIANQTTLGLNFYEQEKFQLKYNWNIMTMPKDVNFRIISLLVDCVKSYVRPVN